MAKLLESQKPLNHSKSKWLETVVRCRLCKVVCEYAEDWDHHCTSRGHQRQVDTDIQVRVERERNKIQKRLEDAEKKQQQQQKATSFKYTVSSHSLKQTRTEGRQQFFSFGKPQAGSKPQPAHRNQVFGKPRGGSIPQPVHRNQVFGKPRGGSIPQPAHRDQVFGKPRGGSTAAQPDRVVSFSGSAPRMPRNQPTRTQESSSCFSSNESYLFKSKSSEFKFCIEHPGIEDQKECVLLDSVSSDQHKIECEGERYDYEATSDSENEDLFHVHPKNCPDDIEHFDFPSSTGQTRNLFQFKVADSTPIVPSPRKLLKLERTLTRPSL